jgi:hypothetical protein
MRKINPVLFLGLLMGFSFASSLYAHHGYASYDMTKTVTVSGTVTEVSRAIEFGMLRALMAEGWTKETLKIGDGVTVSLHPAKNGAHVGVLAGKITFSDGRPLALSPAKQ